MNLLSELPERLATARLDLAPWSAADVDQLSAALAESVDHLYPWVPWATGVRPTADEIAGLLGCWIAERAAGQNAIYALRTRGSGTLVGGAGLYARVGPGRLEIGYWIRRSHAGQGLATEAARALTDLAQETPGVTHVEMHIDPANHASTRVPEKLDYALLERRPHASPRPGRSAEMLIFVRDCVHGER